MIYVSDINKLVSSWIERLNDPRFTQAYKDALSDCVYDVTTLVSSVIEEETKAVQENERIIHNGVPNAKKSIA